MKIRFVRSLLVEVWKPKLEETWDKNLKKWDEVGAESLMENEGCFDVHTYDGDVLIGIPKDSFEIIR